MIINSDSIAFKRLVASELGIHSHHIGIVTTQQIIDFFSPNKKDRSIIITIKFGKKTKKISTFIKYYDSDTHGHAHITITVLKTQFKAKAGDILIFLRDSNNENHFLSELITKNDPRYKLFNGKKSGIVNIKDVVTHPFYDLEDDETAYQEPASYVEKLNENAFPPEKRKEGKEIKSSKQPPRNKKKGEFVLRQNSYKCQIDSSHESFMTGSGKQYAEKHHLIPIEFYEDFDIDIDDISNIVTLCPNCHKKIHFGVTSDINQMVCHLWNQQKQKLNDRGLKINLDKLLEYYK